MQLKSIFALALCIFLALSCTKKESETDNLFKFRDYISYTTSGRISTSSSIDISLAKEVEGWNIGNEIDENLFSIKPHVSGNLKIANKHALTFTPIEPLDPDTEYSVSIKLGKIYQVYLLSFQITPFNLKLLHLTLIWLPTIYSLIAKSGNIY